jgi:hypothetical protein
MTLNEFFDDSNFFGRLRICVSVLFGIIIIVGLPILVSYSIGSGSKSYNNLSAPEKWVIGFISLLLITGIIWLISLIYRFFKWLIFGTNNS